jgi:predicted metalloprotease with PDZ domain
MFGVDTSLASAELPPDPTSTHGASDVVTPIRYAVDLTDRVHHLVRVTVIVPDDVASGARIVLPVWTPGSYVVRNYTHHVQKIRATDTRGSDLPLRLDGTTAWRLPEDVAGPVTVELELYANDLSVRTNHVDDHHALLIPAATFPYIDGATDRPHEVHLPPQPSGHRTWSLIPEGDAPDTYVAEDRDHLIDSAFEVGDLPSIDFEVAGVPHAFVWAGHGGAPDLDAIAEDARAIGEACIALFGDGLPTERYIFLCAGWDQGGGGLEHRDGSVLQMPIRTFQDPDLTARFQSLVAHEYLHLWNVKRLVPCDLVHPDYERPTHTPSLWVAEGWTAYYDELLPTRAKVWTPRRLLDTLRDTWSRTEATPGSQLQPLRQASHEAWTKHYIRDENTPNVMTDYYGHGSLVAWELDLRLRHADPDSDGLDEVFRLLWKRHANTREGYTEQDVVDAIAEIGDDDLATLIDARVEQPQLPQIDDGVLATVGLEWSTETNGPVPPDLGVETTEDDQGVTFGSVLRDGPAWRAGITGGDRLIAIDGVTVARGELDKALLAAEPGDQIEVTVTRGPRLLTLTATLDEPRPRRTLRRRDDATDAAAAAYERWTGHRLSDL